MKSATEPSDASQVRETVTRTRIVPVDSVSEQKITDFWDYVRSIKDSDWSKHIIYLYRDEPSPRVPVQKFQQYLTMPDRTQVPISDQDEFEFAILRYFGGKVYRLLIKRGHQLMATGRVVIDAPARTIEASPEMAAPAGRWL